VLCFLEDVEEAIAHLEEILAHILRVASFKSSYLLTECPEINAIKCIMAVGFPKCGPNRN
jgi:hypothetical protein